MSKAKEAVSLKDKIEYFLNQGKLQSDPNIRQKIKNQVDYLRDEYYKLIGKEYSSLKSEGLK